MNGGFNCTMQIENMYAPCSRCGRAVCLCQHCEQSAPWWRWVYDTGRHKLRATNCNLLVAICMHRDTVMRLRPIVESFIRLHQFMFQHENALQGCVHNSFNCKFPSSSIVCIFRRVTHWACSGCSGSTCTTARANIQQLRTAIEEEWDNIPQATINSLINSMQRRCVVLDEANGGHTRYWLVFWSTTLLFFLRYLWPTDPYLYSQSCEIHRLGPN